IMRYAMQDAARQVSYGMGALRYHLRHQPDQKVALNTYLDGAEHVIFALLGSPELLEPLIIICGGGIDGRQVSRGCAAVLKFMRLVQREYLERVRYAGLERSNGRFIQIISQMPSSI
ncbi:MAG TPA: hypothetical protein VJ728_13490, partial [Candidatus Binataceae bacterium]|nr:hypothetical protein [Candidatus Binataceae bacterium]